MTESSKVSKFSKEEFEAYQKMFHEKWDHNVLKDSFFEEFADEINAKVAEGVLDSKREMAKGLREQGIPEDGGNFFSINCIVNFELKRELASKFGERLVLEPESLRNEIFDDVKKMMDRYGEIKPVH